MQFRCMHSPHLFFLHTSGIDTCEQCDTVCCFITQCAPALHVAANALPTTTSMGANKLLLAHVFSKGTLSVLQMPSFDSLLHPSSE